MCGALKMNFIVMRRSCLINKFLFLGLQIFLLQLQYSRSISVPLFSCMRSHGTYWNRWLFNEHNLLARFRVRPEGPSESEQTVANEAKTGNAGQRRSIHSVLIGIKPESALPNRYEDTNRNTKTSTVLDWSFFIMKVLKIIAELHATKFFNLLHCKCLEIGVIKSR